MYNALFGMHPAAGELLRILKIDPLEAGRFRDCFPSQDGTKIVIYTRCGGGNREAYRFVFENLRLHPLYVRDWDDEFDSTYASIEFKVPEEHAEIVATLSQNFDCTPPEEKWKTSLKDLADGKQTDVTERAKSISAQLFEKMKTGDGGTIGDNNLEVFTPENFEEVKKRMAKNENPK
jgi:hypothetical protein